jgi:hypothetical protein
MYFSRPFCLIGMPSSSLLNPFTNESGRHRTGPLHMLIYGANIVVSYRFMYLTIGSGAIARPLAQ